MKALVYPRERSEAIQLSDSKESWIASSLSLLAMTADGL
jgi:hypothetical protein